MNTKYQYLLPLLLLSTSLSAESFWDVEIGGFQDDNWNRAQNAPWTREDKVYQYGVKYGFSQALSPHSGLIYSAKLEHHDWQDYPLLNNTRWKLGLSYQQRLQDPLNSPWWFVNVDAAYHRYDDKKRRATHTDISTGLGQTFTKWQYLFTAGWKQDSAKHETFDSQAGYFTSSLAFKPIPELKLGIKAGFEKGDVISSTVTSQKPSEFESETHDDAFMGKPWYAYRLDADTLWQALFVNYGWHGKHEISAELQQYDSETTSRNYDGVKISLLYTHLF